jgi:cell division FtsZ-interacting protein ZapD
MIQRKSTGKSSEASSRQCERLKDEVYRQMYRQEASRPGADLALALALLRAWITSDSATDISHDRKWLMKISPICLAMIEATQKVSDGEQQCAS